MYFSSDENNADVIRDATEKLHCVMQLGLNAMIIHFPMILTDFLSIDRLIEM